MHKIGYTTLSTIMMLFLVILSTNVPVTANENPKRFEHSIAYHFKGRINIEREFGQLCMNGSVKKQRIRGYADLTKVEVVKMAPHIMSIYEKTDWSTASDAIRGLTVTTTIELCARPMAAAAQNYTFSPDFVISKDSIVNIYAPWVVSGNQNVLPLSSQVWATEVSTNPGQSGSYHIDYIAAYGPGPYEADGVMITDEYGFKLFHHYEDKYRWWFDLSKKGGIDRGDYYVGNYFKLDHYAYTSGGELRRFFSMSSPFSNSFMVEDLRVIGMAEVREFFNLDNLKPGPKAIQLTWWEWLF